MRALRVHGQTQRIAIGVSSAIRYTHRMSDRTNCRSPSATLQILERCLRVNGVSMDGETNKVEICWSTFLMLYKRQTSTDVAGTEMYWYGRVWKLVDLATTILLSDTFYMMRSLALVMKDCNSGRNHYKMRLQVCRAASDFLCVFVPKVATSSFCVSFGLLASRIVPVSRFCSEVYLVLCHHPTRFIDDS